MALTGLIRPDLFPAFYERQIDSDTREANCSVSTKSLSRGVSPEIVAGDKWEGSFRGSVVAAVAALCRREAFVMHVVDRLNYLMRGSGQKRVGFVTLGRSLDLFNLF